MLFITPSSQHMEHATSYCNLLAVSSTTGFFTVVIPCTARIFMSPVAATMYVPLVPGE